MKRTETLTILSFFAIASLMMVMPSADAAEPIITHTQKNITVDMSDIISEIGTDFEYKVKISTECDIELDSNMYISKTNFIDPLTQSKVIVSGSGLEKGNDYGVSYKIKDQDGKTPFSTYCIESLGTFELTSIDDPLVVAEPIITHTRKNIKVDMSDMIIALGTDFEYKVKVSTECDTELDSNNNIYKTKWIDSSIESEMYVVSSDFEKGKDYGVSYKIKKPIGENKYFPITCIESLGIDNTDLTSVDDPVVDDPVVEETVVEDDPASDTYSVNVAYYKDGNPVTTDLDLGDYSITCEEGTDKTLPDDYRFALFMIYAEGDDGPYNYPSESNLPLSFTINDNIADDGIYSICQILDSYDKIIAESEEVFYSFIDSDSNGIADWNEPEKEDGEITEKNYVNAEFNKTDRELTVSWDFGTNPDRTSCNLKTEYLTYDVLGLNATSDFLGVNYVRTSYLHFLGYDWENTGVNYVAISNSDKTNVMCADSFTMDIIETNLFSSYFTFTQFDELNEKITNFELQVVIAEGWDLTPEVCGELNPITDEFAFRQFVFDSNGKTDTLFDPVEGCYTRIDNPPVNDVVEEKKNKSSGGCSDCTPPTLGKDSDGVQRVWNGVGINGHFEDGDYFYTEYPMQYTEIGKTNNVILKYWENHGPYNIEVIQLGIGVDEVGSSLGESQAIIEVWMDYFSNDIENPVIGTIKVVDRDGILDYVAAVPSLVNCNQSDEQTINQCLQVEFVYSYAKVPESPVLMSNAFDYKKNNINDYFNDGLTVIDPNYVEPLPETPYKYECQDRVKPSMDRNNCVFADIVKIEQDKALAVFNSTNISNSE